MRALPVAVLATIFAMSVQLQQGLCASGRGRHSRYTFYRNVLGNSSRRSEAAGGGRRVFGGEPAPLAMYPAVCALLDRYWSVWCSAAVVKPTWAVTAAHCVTPRVSYVKYNSRRISSADGDVAPVLFLYKHPKFEVQFKEDADGVDVAQLHHDVGMVRTRTAMAIASPLDPDPLIALLLYSSLDLKNEELQVVGFGRTENSPLGEELFGVRLRAVSCNRGEWIHCMCGLGKGREGARGVCSGDSGGPVLFRGSQVAVTSMGPVECNAIRGGYPSAGATSVFTMLYPYADLLLSTINETDASLGMRRLKDENGSPVARILLLRVLVLSLCLCAYSSQFTDI